MARRRPPKKQGPIEPPKRPRGNLEPSGEPYEGAVIERVVATGQRAAVWTGDAYPAASGVLMGIDAIAAPPSLVIAANGAIRRVALRDITALEALAPGETPGGGPV